MIPSPIKNAPEASLRYRSFPATSLSKLLRRSTAVVRLANTPIKAAKEASSPASCYHGCNIVDLFQGTTLEISSTIGTSTSTPTGTYTLTMVVNPDSCPIGVTDCTHLSTSVSATLTVT